jgi:mannose-6-phosphate isomerase-like protein (cupin superfamily)
VPVNADIGIHTHALDNEEMYIIVSGAGRIHLDGREFEVGAGDGIVNRPSGTHGLVNIGNTD